MTDKTVRGARMQQKLQTSEVRYRRLFEAAKDGLLLLNADTGRITDVNPFLEDMLRPRYAFAAREFFLEGFNFRLKLPQTQRKFVCTMRPAPPHLRMARLVRGEL